MGDLFKPYIRWQGSADACITPKYALYTKIHGHITNLYHKTHCRNFINLDKGYKNNLT